MKFRTSVDLPWTPSGGSTPGRHPDTLSQKAAVNTSCGCLLFGVSSFRCSDIDSSPSKTITRSLNRSQVYLLPLFAGRFLLVLAVVFQFFRFSACLLRSSVPALFCLFWLFFLPSACVCLSIFCLFVLLLFCISAWLLLCYCYCYYYCGHYYCFDDDYDDDDYKQ